MKHFTLVLGVFFAVCVFRCNGYSNEEIFEDWNCISESGDNDLCNGFQDCLKLAPECLKLPYYYCIRKILPNGPGSCSKTQQAYGNKEKRIKINKCYADIAALPNGDDWTTNPELAPFLDCVELLGKKCKQEKAVKVTNHRAAEIANQ
ncbi:unnamed protein product [Larinioides sclopetarius]|uniref:Uncharacterized protein n=1 Tax=Larinioides sclopetarius TaxID=280406 RepID=A0AAV2ART4_9ARAC